ncbi:hypothetical protein LI951_10160 [Enterococcus sp. BWT-B8]|uniref:hypothetical protein n=1 Tax=unclassified Enterococcus TaxID=2608891 RepID=UPI001E36F5E4|nr:MULTISPECIES: hypothetical protein [unclassified Enterococcus]MCB5952427.1 hypothetical protein [Enterococcus sp. BWT-B8]MCB5955380.1 hypothetical protein [Enterococcus sp. CWB-B31]
MADKNMNFIRSEIEIPEEVLKDLEKNRQRILSHEVEQKINTKKHKKTVILAVLAVAVAMILFVNPQVNSAIRNALGISKDSGVAAIEDKGIENNLNLVSKSNDMEITLTKFVSTKRKMAFEYQFKMDEELKTLLEKNSKTEDPWAKTFEFIDVSLYVNGGTKDIYGGVSGSSTSRVEGDMFYGSVFSTFDKEIIPENAKLTLHITRLAWQDKEAAAAEISRAMENPDPTATFTIENAIEYEGDWSFDIEYKPLMQTAAPEISNINNISDIQVKSDALQTVVKFKAPVNEDSRTAVTIYKDGVKLDGVTHMGSQQIDEISVTFSLSALDKTNSVYTVQLNKIDSFGEPIEEIGYFDLKNN